MRGLRVLVERRALTAILVLSLSACVKVGPDYVAPQIALTPQFALSRGAQSDPSGPQTAWWADFNDSTLSALLDQGAHQNLDVQTALARLDRASAQLRTTGVNAQTSGDISDARVRSEVENFEAVTSDTTTVGAGYVVDLFGGFARDRERETANLQVAQYDVGLTRLSVLAEITNAYITARYHQKMIEIVDSAITSDRRLVRLVAEKRGEGLSTQLEEQQALVRLARTEAELPRHRAQYDVQVFRLATLLALPAAEIYEQIDQGTGQPRPGRAALAGVPADLLRNRPDVRMAERQLAADMAAVGVAQAQLYPSLRLSGSITFDTLDSWNFTRGLVVPVLNRGVLLGNRDARIARAEEAELEWRDTVLNAVEDVQVALRETASWAEQIVSLNQVVEATRKLEALSVERLDLGQGALSEVLDANKQHAEARQLLTDAIRQYALAWVRVQIASGRGWQAQPQPTQETAPPAAVPDPAGIEPVMAVARQNPEVSR